MLAGEPAALVDQIDELAECGVEHLVLEFLAADGRDLDEQMVDLRRARATRAQLSDPTPGAGQMPAVAAAAASREAALADGACRYQRGTSAPIAKLTMPTVSTI